MPDRDDAPHITRSSHVLSFGWRVVTKFFGENKGFLLVGAVGYNALLSMIPLFAILLAALSRFFDQDRLLEVVGNELVRLTPGQKDLILEAIRRFLADRALIPWIAIPVLLFFSSLAFRMLEDAMKVVFKHHPIKRTRHPALSFLIPYLYIGATGLILVVLTILTALLDQILGLAHRIGITFGTQAFERFAIYGISMLVLWLMLSSTYVVLPQARVKLRKALIGGGIAAVLWEIVRTFLVWYFANLSLVNVVYGSLTTVVIVLLSFEIGAGIILLGAQVIAEIEVSQEAGLPWHTAPQLTDDGTTGTS